jgi:MerR family transcriptional regulator, copper efflux regulator
MLISEFARVTGLTRDTVRFCARLGLLQPQTNGKGGRLPYSVFGDKDIQAAEVIQILQSLGMSLKEIAAINEERRNGELTCERSLEITTAQLMRLEAKATELEMMIRYVRAKIAWLKRGRQGRRPHFSSYMRRGSRVNVEQTDSAVEGTVNQPSIA